MAPRHSVLTAPPARELDVLRCRMQGLTWEQVAEALDISTNTVRVHNKRLMQKTGATNALQLGMWAQRNLNGDALSNGGASRASSQTAQP